MDTNQTEEFLRGMFGDVSPGLFFLIWTLPDKRSRWYPTTPEGIERAVRDISRFDDHDVYVGSSLAEKAYGSRQRVTAEESAGITAVWADVDYDDPAHKKPNLPPTESDAIRLVLDALPEPTVLVHSGHGLQAWWMLDEPLIFHTPEDRRKGAMLVAGLQARLREQASEQGWAVDSTHDLARVMRVPGTINRKGIPPVPCETRTTDGPRYTVGGLSSHTSAVELPSPASSGSLTQAEVQAGADFTLSNEAEPPFSKWEALREADRNVELTWQRTRRGMADESASAWDMALANYAALAGWTDQEIVNLMVASRRKHGDSLKLNRVDYYIRTIRKARDLASRALATESIDDALHDLEEMGDRDDDDVDRRRVLTDHLSAILGTGIVRIERLGTEPSHFRMETEAGWVDLGTTDELLSQGKVRARVVEVTKTVFPRMKAPEWDRVAEAMVRAAEAIDMGPEPTISGGTKAWLADYLDQHYPADGIDESVASTKSPFLMDQQVHVFPAHFRTWIDRHEGERLAVRELTMRLRGVGGFPKKVNLRVNDSPTSRSVWVIPAYAFSDADGIKVNGAFAKKSRVPGKDFEPEPVGSEN